MSAGGRTARAAAVGTGIAAGIAIGTMLADGRLVEVVFAVVLVVGLMVLARILVPVEVRLRVAAIAGLAFSAHVAVAVLLHAWSLAAGWGGFITGDDEAYARLAAGFVSYLQGRPEPPLVPPYWGGDEYLFGAWVYLESALFYLFGPRVLVALLTNAAFAVASSLLVFDASRRLFGIRAGLVALSLVAFWPSLVVWSSLNLKDALAQLLITLVLWGFLRFHLDRRWWHLSVSVGSLVPLASLRGYVFVGMALTLPLVVLLTPWLYGARRIVATAAALLLAMLLIGGSEAGVMVGPGTVATLEATRYAMAVGARTAFAEHPPLLVRDGASYVVAAGAAPVLLELGLASAASPSVSATVQSVPIPLPSVVPASGPGTASTIGTTAPVSGPASGTAPSTPPPQRSPSSVATPRSTASIPLPSVVPASGPATVEAAGTTSSPGATSTPVTTTGPVAIAAVDREVPSSPLPPRIVHVEPGTRIKVIPGYDEMSVGAEGMVYLRPGDVLIVGRPQATLAPGERPAPLVIPESARGIRLRTTGFDADGAVRRALEYLPYGLAHALFAPFPWTVRRALDLPAVAEMLGWYGALPAASMTLLSNRRRWRVLAPICLFVSGGLVMLALAEGNVGTLYRHRAMVIPFVLLFAAPTLAVLMTAARRGTVRVPPVSSDAATLLAKRDRGSTPALSA